ncbi:MAG: Pycsar system effector family protein [Bacteroidota bacterium]
MAATSDSTDQKNSDASADPAAPSNTAKQASKKKRKKLGSRKRGISDMFRSLYRVQMDLSALADTKANIMISINGIIVSILLASISPGIDKNTFLLYPTIALLVGCVISLVFAILAARPRLNTETITMEDVRANRKNLLFFGNFTGLSRAEFEDGLTDLMQDGELLYVNMIRDIYGIGQVLEKKFKLLRWSYTLFMLGLIIGVSLFILAYLTVEPIGAPTTPGLILPDSLLLR